ncbi:hypothetical protein ALC57_06264, partial [Trachymyrmex cornetzi]
YRNRGGIPPVLVTMLTSAQLRKVSGLPHPTASVPFSQVPHMFPDSKTDVIRDRPRSDIAQGSKISQ